MDLFDKTFVSGLIRLREHNIANIFIKTTTYSEVKLIRKQSDVEVE